LSVVGLTNRASYDWVDDLKALTGALRHALAACILILILAYPLLCCANPIGTVLVLANSNGYIVAPAGATHAPLIPTRTEKKCAYRGAMKFSLNQVTAENES